MMFFSKITLRNDAPAQQIARLAAGNPYLDHAALWRLFSGSTPPDAARTPRSFLFHRISSSPVPAFYVLSNSPPTPNEDLWQIQSSEFSPALRAGLCLEFLLRANPVVTQADDAGRHLRRDVVMVRKHALKQQKIPHDQWPSPTVIIQEECVRWLQARAARCGFALMPAPDQPPPFHLLVRTSAYRQHVLRKSGTAAPIRFSSVDFSGVLQVTDPDTFRTALYHGIGPAKGFGCGLLLIKPCSTA